MTQAFQLHAKAGQRFCLFHAARGDRALGSVLYLHPFAEEMNKSRRMAALQSRALAQAGYAVLQIDLLGCGDSSGDFGDASWEAWVDDVRLACAWLQRHAPAPLWLWGLRSGCLLAAYAARQLDQRCHLLFWQPSSSGKLVLHQFIRLKLASELIGGSSKGTTEALRKSLASGSSVEVAGYTLSPALASGLEQAALQPPPHAARLEWLELSMQAGATLSPQALANLSSWQHAGWQVAARQVSGAAFWQSTEIEEAPALIDATLASLIDPVAA
jgi:exosortase A-associated hydrolase 2